MAGPAFLSLVPTLALIVQLWVPFLPHFGTEEVSEENAWQRIVLEDLPPHLQTMREIMEAVPSTRIDNNGYLMLRDKTASYKQVPLVIEGEPDWSVRELLTDQYGKQTQWAVVLQRAINQESNDAYLDAHFTVNAEGFFQTKEPGAEKTPLVIWNLRQIDWDYYARNGQPYVRSAYSISRNYSYSGFDSVLVALHEVKIGIHRRAIVIKVDERLEDGSSQELSNDLTANLLSLLWALRTYGIGPWEILDSLEIYGPNGDHTRYLGIQTATKLRYYLGVLALVRGSEEDKELYFGPFMEEGSNREKAVENYFTALRQYLMMLNTPQEIQRWDSATGYWLLHDMLFETGELLPVADHFVYPIPVEIKTPGGYQHLEEEFDEEGGKRGTFHIGEDFNIGSGNQDKGHPFSAIGAGQVIYTGYVYNRMGNLIVIRHRLPDGSQIYSRYAHLEDTYVEMGQMVSPLEIIGTIGRSGREDDPDFYAHLHVDLSYEETYERFLATDPGYYFNTNWEAVDRYFLDLLEFLEQSQEITNPRGL